ncbi:DUF2407 C-terminal domain-containing protein [Lineolata rhizophorae]|uniref:DUF2407 C-terminal domain-containing protein n=1 Tax=Lineolata rhizophorae TaxID=578093 RepID=A0A6A6P9Q0_9PEZI|nr:DUF2407 C-terminal domain-containing protein [Lineolata rhizophorae]
MSYLRPQQQPQPLPLNLIIRFTQSIPDLPLNIPSATTITPLSVKVQIRSHLPGKFARNPLRLIHGGKVLPDRSSLASCVRIPPPPPQAAPPPPPLSPPPPKTDVKGKGKAPLREEPAELAQLSAVVRKVYIHCSIGEGPLSAADLDNEATTAASLEESLSTPPADPSGGRKQSPGATPAPQGFDRLLAAGFTPAEVAALRSQFTSNIAYAHTPDTMPSGQQLRALEDRWLDSGAQEGGGGLGGSAAGGGGANGEDGGWGGGFGTEDGGGLDDMLWGNLVGFFWPLGALVWGCREEGVWSRRRKVAVGTGLMMNLLFGFLRLTS